MSDPITYKNITLEDIDRSIRDWFDKTVNVRVKTPQEEMHKVPTIFSSGERWATGRTKQTFRDDNGVLILPIISVRRVSVDPDTSKMALGVQTDKIQVSKLVNPDTSRLRNLQAPPVGVTGRDRWDHPPVYDVYTIPFPDRMQATYQLVIQAQFISQMNDILQKVWKSLDIQKSFVAPLENDGRSPPRVSQYENAPQLHSRYVVGFLDSGASDSGNLEEFTDTERIIKYSTEIRVPFVLLTSPEGQPYPVKVERTSYKLVINSETVTSVNDPRMLDKIFGKPR